MILNSELAKDAQFEGVKYDSERSILLGHYNDELSLYRARKTWKSLLQSSFLLEENFDFVIATQYFETLGKYVLECEFNSACGRYTFWRVTNSQSPEAQYLIETAHIPLCSSRHNDLIQAPDMKPLSEECFNLDAELYRASFRNKKPVSKWLEKLFTNNLE